MHILLFCDFELPDSCADASRVFNFAKLLDTLGHKVDILGVCYSGKAKNCGNYLGFEYKMITASAHRGIFAFKRIRGIEKSLKKHLLKHTGENKYDLILISNVYFDYSRVILKYKKTEGAISVVNAVEWFDRNNEIFKGVKGKINLLKNRIALKYTHKKMGNILAISSLLDEYYKKRGCNTVIIPTVLDMQSYEKIADSRAIRNDTIRIVYAGNPGKKDYILNAILALELLTEDERARIRFDFYGPNENAILTNGFSVARLESIRNNVVFHGRIPYEEVKGKIADADFTVLLRPNRRYSNAGFPTKVGESMACGTPVIANITSDLGKYIIDGKTGIVCENETKEAFADALRRVLAMDVEQRLIMRGAALLMARNSFDYKIYATAIEEFIKRAI